MKRGSLSPDENQPLAQRAVRGGLWVLAVIQAVSSIGILLMERELRFRQSSITQSVSEPLSYLLAFYLAATGQGVFALVGKAALGTLLKLIGIWWAVLHWRSDLIRLQWSFDLGFARSLAKSGTAIGVTQMVSNVQQHSMNSIAGTFLGEKQLGFLNRVHRLSSWSYTLFGDLLKRAGFSSRIIIF